MQPGWQLVQQFGNDEEESTISAIKWSDSGDHLAAGDKNGRIHVFKRTEQQSKTVYKLYAAFVSHEHDFDQLKSIDIEEKIKDIAWLRSSNGLNLLASNTGTIKLWRVYEREVKEIESVGHDPSGYAPMRVGSGPDEPFTSPRSSSGSDSTSPRVFPSVVKRSKAITPTLRREYKKLHAYHIHSLSPNTDGETFLSADDLRVNLWSLDTTDRCFTVVDRKPANMEDLEELITTATFHPSHCHIFAYGTSGATFRILDMRRAAFCDRHSQVFSHPNPDPSSAVGELSRSITDLKFSHDGRNILTRDHLTLKLWDLHMNSRPVKTYDVNEHLRDHLVSLFEQDCFFDQFKCDFSPDDKSLLTGTYNNQLVTLHRDTRDTTVVEAARRAKNKPPPSLYNEGRLDVHKKLLLAAWHPTEARLCSAGRGRLSFFTPVVGGQ